ncbi:NAD-dependent epimerase/dehydratase family protein [Pseudosulfitobacter pseudonitzschiae]|uniref:NAD-dependent epimerase/dehydratase family protein n=2 Tax=Pseudosulfitobacter pseudonitzschiae TaxID=1402135 RepID=UPI001E374ACC|nr:NAD-dependent epimerase/dehydratase family protein [Pseudosulfitobacter pseudonitzschiae]MBM2255483.1 NAD-dependent epimerase/dehydratase family protein [Pseudosulfitobacter pseudonitzschiae]UFF36428.1 NAD-dependent epimerase/dehydratase family protein [Pseudosulfitobacter pseudonitzschiae]
MNFLLRKILDGVMPSTPTRPDFNNKRLVVLGATGRLGGILRKQWKSDAVRWQARTERDGFHRVDILNDPKALRDLCSGADAVLCLAGVTRGNPAALQHNTDLARAAITAANGARVFLASSAAVYGAGGKDLRETDAVTPLSPYGQAKLAMEQAALSSGAPVTCLRIGNVAGADAILGGWHSEMALDTDAEGRTPRRSYIGPQTLARTLAHVITAVAPPPVLNISAPGSVQMGALLDAAGLPWRSTAPSGPVIWDVTLSTDRLALLAPFAPQDSTAAGIAAEWHHARDPQ